MAPAVLFPSPSYLRRNFFVFFLRLLSFCGIVVVPGDVRKPSSYEVATRCYRSLLCPKEWSWGA